MTNRNRHEILASLVRSSINEKHGLGITKLMYSSFLSQAQVMEFVNELVKHDLLSFEPNAKKYKVTDKGMIFVSVVDSLEEMLKGKSIL
jgi:predicted transcriptional regulator